MNLASNDGPADDDLIALRIKGMHDRSDCFDRGHLGVWPRVVTDEN
jgi:hypothetical protein